MNAKIEKRYNELICTNREAGIALLKNWYSKHPEELESDFEKILADNADLLKRMKHNEVPVAQQAEASGLNPVQ